MARHIDEATQHIGKLTGEEPVGGAVEIARDIGIIALAAFPCLLSSRPSDTPAEVLRLVNDVLHSMKSPYELVLDADWQPAKVIDDLKAIRKTTGDEGAWRWTLEGFPASLHHLHISSDDLGERRAETLRAVLLAFNSHLLSISGLNSDEIVEVERNVKQWLAQPVRWEWLSAADGPASSGISSGNIAGASPQPRSDSPITDKEYIHFVAGVSAFAPELLRAIAAAHLHVYKDPTASQTASDIVENDLKFLAAWIFSQTHAEAIANYRSASRRQGGFRGLYFGTPFDEVERVLGRPLLLRGPPTPAESILSAELPDEEYGGIRCKVRLDFAGEPPGLCRALLQTCPGSA